MADDTLTRPDGGSLEELVEQLTAMGEASASNCVDLSEFSELVQSAELDEDDAQLLAELLEGAALMSATTAVVPGWSAPPI